MSTEKEKTPRRKKKRTTNASGSDIKINVGGGDGTPPSVKKSTTPLMTTYVEEGAPSGPLFRTVDTSTIVGGDGLGCEVCDLLCPVGMRKQIYLFFYGSLMFGCTITSTLALAWGPHYIGFIAALVLGLFASVGLGRAASSQCRCPVHSALKWLFLLCLFLLIILCGLFLVIYLLNFTYSDIEMGFPRNCTGGENCVRVMLYNGSYHNDHLKSPTFNNTAKEIMTAVKYWLDWKWVETTRPIAENVTYIHSRCITIFFGWTDDFYVNFLPNDRAGAYAIEVQSASRIGKNDFGQNLYRVSEFLNYLEKEANLTHISYL